MVLYKLKGVVEIDIKQISKKACINRLLIHTMWVAFNDVLNKFLFELMM